VRSEAAGPERSAAAPRGSAARPAAPRPAASGYDPRPRPSRPSRSGRSRRRWRLLIPAAIALIAVVMIMDRGSAKPSSFPAPSRTRLAGLSVGQRIVSIARSQLGYTTDPSGSYCNKFSAYWGVGSQSCPGAESSEEWCADFAAWAWQHAGVPFSYGFNQGQINAAAASFYAWGVYHGTWHSAASGYRARPGDVAVYGLRVGASDSAAHVAIVTNDPGDGRGPDVINGDGDRTGFSVVEAGSHQLRADAGHGHGAPLAGYVSPD
jgi:hypothetical protein